MTILNTEALNATTKEIRSSKRTFEQKLATNIKQDSKSFFAYIRSKQRVKDSIGPLKGNNGAVISNNKEMAESINEYFSTVFTLEDINALPATEQLLEEGKTCLEQLVVTRGMIEAKIKGLKDNKSPGGSFHVNSTNFWMFFHGPPRIVLKFGTVVEHGKKKPH